MYLQENTEAARAMRRNIARLISTDSGANRALAFEMIKAGGMPLEVLVDVYHLYFPTWGQSSALSNERREFADNLLSQALPDRIFKTIKQYLAGLDLPYGRRHFIFRGNDFFDMLIADGIADLNRLAECWQASDTWLEFTDLTLFLLQHVDAIDKNIFIDSRLPKHQLHHRAMRVLLEFEDVAFNKKAFVAQYIKGNILDLSHTGSEELPPICLDFPEVDTLVLDGTNIRQLPEQLLFQLKEIQCNEKRIRHFEREIAKMPFQDFYLATQLTLKKAELDFAGKNYAGTIQKLQSIEDRVLLPSFSAERICTFWETYFTAALDSGQTALAQEILKKGFERIPDPYGPLRWKNWGDRMLQFVLEGSIEEWQAIEPPLGLGKGRYSQIFYLGNQNFWIHAFRVTVSQNRLEDAARLLELALQYTDNETIYRFPWYLYFKKLHALRQTKKIVDTLRQFALPIGRRYQYWSRHQNRIGELSTIWIEAYLKEGQPENVEAYCAAMISYFHQVPSRERNKLYASFNWSQENAVNSYRYLARMYAAMRPVCAQYFQEMAHKHKNPNQKLPTILEQVLSDVNHNYNPDFWSDVERPRLLEKLQQFTHQDWAGLELCWIGLDVFGKIYLADALSSIEKVHSRNLLTKMLSDRDPIVGATVAIALLELNYRWNPKVSILSDLQRHHDKNTGYEQEQIARLIARLPR